MRRKKGSGNRDIGMNSNGKGSANRTGDNAAFAANYEAIDWGRGAVEMPGTIKYPGDDSYLKPILPEGWRFLEADEIVQGGDLWEFFSGRRDDCWTPVLDFRVGKPASQVLPCNMIRKLEAGAFKEIFPSDDVTDIAERNPS